MATAADLVGAWRLERWSLVPDDGGPAVHPLGEDAVGFILYTPDGHVSALLTRAAPAPADAFAYAGRFEVAGDEVAHLIEVCADPALVGFRNRRRIALEGDRLTLSGPDFSAGTARTQRIIWRRAA